ncbi:MAG: NYN domain-containing protein [Bacteroidetes bacterium]|nr:MAG: NYN domain-containing protein [Bacteroidota bacterium]
MNISDNKLTRIGVFYDGNYFFHVSNYYNYEHSRKARLSIAGLHEFIRREVAKAENTDMKLCQVVDAHYFRGRLSSYEAEEQNKLLSERIFDDILMNEGVVTHYLPLRNRDGKYEEKGIDVWLALESYELSINKQFNIVVLIASDGDYMPLIRKLNTLGIRVMVLAWDFEYTDDRTGKLKKTTTSIELLREVTYPILMQEIIDNKVMRTDPIINNLFVHRELYQNTRPKPEYNIPVSVIPTPTTNGTTNNGTISNGTNNNTPTKNEISVTPLPNTGFSINGHEHGTVIRSSVHSLKNGYGFINYPPNNLFFHWRNLINCDFNDLKESDLIEFKIKRGEKGDDVAYDVMRPLDPFVNHLVQDIMPIVNNIPPQTPVLPHSNGVLSEFSI